MITWTSDVCGCVLSMDPESGQPSAFLSACSLHQDGAPSDPADLCRGKNLCVALSAKAHTVDPSDVRWSVSGTEITCTYDGSVIGTGGPVTMAQYIAASVP